jgi:hypothetical protein
LVIPEPEPGLVIQFNYLWRREHDEGRDNARYPRPCAIILSLDRAGDGEITVLVAAITHANPREGAAAIPMPPAVKRHLGLDEAQSWVIVDEVNEFIWPGHDLALNAKGELAYGFIPRAFYERIRIGVLAAAAEGRLGRVRR